KSGVFVDVVAEKGILVGEPMVHLPVELLHVDFLRIGRDPIERAGAIRQRHIFLQNGCSDSVLAAGRDQTIRKRSIVRQRIGSAGYESIPLFLGRHGGELRDALANACILESTENESTVLDYRPSRAGAILVAPKRGPRGA